MAVAFATLPPKLGATTLEAADRAGIAVLVARGGRGQRSHTYVNASAERILGRSREEILSLDPDAYLDPGSKLELDRRAEQSREAVVVEGAVITKSGSRLASRIVSLPFEREQEPFEMRLLIDARARLRVEDALSRFRVRSMELIDRAPDAVAIIGRDKLLYANPALLRLMQCRSVSELGSVPPAQLVDPAHYERASVALAELLCGGQAQRTARIRVRGLDGASADVECSGMATEWEGEPACMIVARDLSERKAKLSQRIEADRSTSVGTLSAGVAHEINNPLAYVLLNLEYLMREVPRWDGSAARLEHFRERLEEAQHGANRVAAILRELSSLSARSSERRTLVDVEQVLRRAAKQVEAQIAEHGALVLELHEVPRVVGDFGRLEQLFTNLLVNAAQALVPGVSGEVSVRLCAPAPNWIEIEVADTGAGIPASDLGRVFDPFFTTKPVGVGTGLGLPICHAIVRSLGGHITVESDVGRGSRFRVMLPAAPASYRPTEPPISAVASSRRGRTRVLIVDDEAPIAQMLGRVLEDANDVEVCTDPSQALELLTSGRPYDVVLCDLLMPKISGMDLYEELARRAPGQERKVVFMTGGAFTRRAAEFLRRVPNERLEKPFDIEQVRELLARLGPRH